MCQIICLFQYVLVIALIGNVRIDAIKPSHRHHLGHESAFNNFADVTRTTVVNSFSINCNLDVRLPRGLEGFDKMVGTFTRYGCF